MLGVPFERTPNVRLGFIGLGGRGRSLLSDLLAIEGVAVPALCDINPNVNAAAQAQLQKAGRPAAELYGATDTDFEKLVARNDLDMVIVATPWDWHVPMALAAMKAGHHVAVEVPAATTLDDCWDLVDTSEATRRHCVILENCCYGYNEMLVLNLARAGEFGELTYAEAAYIHDLRGELTSKSGEGLWRRKPHTERNGNLYPTHGLGPVARYLDIHRGDRFVSMVSMSSKEAGLSQFVKEHFPEGAPERSEKYVCGDMNTSLIQTALGRMILLQHDVVSPRPYSRLNMISGTKGTFADYPARIFFDAKSEDWESLEAYKKHEHPLWTRVGEIARKLGGHGGMDFIMCYRLIECLREGLPPEMDVYDAAAWSAPTPLSEESVALAGAPQLFPDFTRGHWEKRS